MTDEKISRAGVRGSYVIWTHMEKGSPSNISGANPTHEQIDDTKAKIHREIEALNDLKSEADVLIAMLEGMHKNVR